MFIKGDRVQIVSQPMMEYTRRVLINLIGETGIVESTDKGDGVYVKLDNPGYMQLLLPYSNKNGAIEIADERLRRV